MAEKFLSGITDVVIADSQKVADQMISTQRLNPNKVKIIFNGINTEHFQNKDAEILPIFDIFVLSSESEGLPLSLCEAAAAGKPVVATNVGGNPEVVVDGETGFLVPPKDPDKMTEAIIRLLRDKELAQKMGEAGRRRVEEKFSLDRMVREYEQVYEECLVRCKHVGR